MGWKTCLPAGMTFSLGDILTKEERYWCIALTTDNKWYTMPLVRAKLVRHVKVREDNGNIIEVKMWQLNPSTAKPHGYKYSLVYIVKGKRIIGYDNAEGKGDHRHYGEKAESYRFTTVWQLIDDFFQDVERYKKGDKL